LQEPRATLPDDDVELADLARVSADEWKAIKPIIMPALQQLPSGRWFSPRQMEESEKQDKRKSAGSKGGSQKEANRVAALEDATATAIEVSCQSGGEGGEIEPPPGFPKNEEEAVAMGVGAGVRADICRTYWLKLSSSGWRDGAGQPVRNFLKYIRYIQNLKDNDARTKERNPSRNSAGHHQPITINSRNDIAGAGNGEHLEVLYHRGLLPKDHPDFEPTAKRVAEKMAKSGREPSRGATNGG
jgi:hypothetical protein